MEGECRLLQAEIVNKRDLKYVLRNAIRPARFLKSLLREDSPDYLAQVPGLV